MMTDPRDFGSGCHTDDIAAFQRALEGMMDTSKFVARLEAIGISDDPEGGHVEADDILVEALRALGANDIADAYEKLKDGFWYS